MLSSDDERRSIAVPPRLGDSAPAFSARTTHGERSLESFRGKWLILFAHPADFTPVCTSEFVALARAYDRIQALGCELLGLSTDSLHAHIAWLLAIESKYDLEIPFAVIEDPSMVVAEAYGMIHPSAEDSSAVRGVYFIDPAGVIRAIMMYPAEVGRSVDEMIRTLSALQTADQLNVLTPEGWQTGQATLPPVVTTIEEARRSARPTGGASSKQAVRRLGGKRGRAK